MDLYKQELGALSFPADASEASPYPFYDRWGDTFNLTQEFVIVNQARALGYLAWLMAQTPLKKQPWKPIPAQITGLPAKVAAGTKLSLELSASGADLTAARIVWEANEQEPALGKTFTFAPSSRGAQWVEAEAQLPDGHRFFSVTNFVIGNRLVGDR